MKKLVSYSFFRHKDSAYESERCGESRGIFFVNYLRAIVRAHHSVYPDFELRIHHDDLAMQFEYWKALRRMADAGLLTLHFMGKAQYLCGSMVWRMAPIWDSSVSVVLCRDVDSLSTMRERMAVERWMESKASIHVIHDSISHAGVMGGTIAFKTNLVRDRMQVPPPTLSYHNQDQNWLNAIVEPVFSKEILYDNTVSMGERLDPRDMLCNGVGLAFKVDPVVEFYKSHPEMCPVLDTIEKCEEGWIPGCEARAMTANSAKII